MPPQEVRKFIGGSPFMPFRLHVTDGSSHDITEPLGIYIDMLHVEVGVDSGRIDGLVSQIDLDRPKPRHAHRAAHGRGHEIVCLRVATLDKTTVRPRAMW